MSFAYILLGYIFLGYAVGVPLAAVLDFFLRDENSKHPKAAIGSAIIIWPLAVFVALVAFPLLTRDYFHAKLDAESQNRSKGA